MRRILRIALLVALAPLAGACATASAKAKPADVPALNVPPPPPRVIEPAPTPESEPEPVGDLPASPPSTAPAKPARREPAPKQPVGEVKPEKPAEPPPAEPPPAAVQQPVPQLRTPETADTSEAAKTVRTTIDRARATLGAVNFSTLSNERKKAYNDAKMFLEQAETALKQGNYGFAQGVATKAETLARELAGG